MIWFFRKPDVRQILIKIINYNGNELIWLGRRLNWPLLIIFRHGSKPKSLQIHQNLFGNAQNHPPKKQKNVKFSENRCYWKTLSSKVDLIWQLRPIRKVENARTLIFYHSYFLQKLDFYDQKTYFYPVFWSQPQFSMKKHFFIWSHLGFISWRIYSLVQRVRHNSKMESKNDLLNTKCPRI